MSAPFGPRAEARAMGPVEAFAALKTALTQQLGLVSMLVHDPDAAEVIEPRLNDTIAASLDAWTVLLTQSEAVYDIEDLLAATYGRAGS